MSQIFDALHRSGALIPALDTGETVRDLGMAPFDQVPSLEPEPAALQRLPALAGTASIGTEKLRMLATRLVDIQRQKELRTLLITSSIQDEGKSILAANLAVSLATMQKRVLLLDGDFYESGLSSLLGAEQFPGLESWWRTNGPVVDYLGKIKNLPLWLLPAGKPFPQTLEMLQSSRLSNLLDELSGAFDWVVIDSPPLAPLADASIWARLADGALLVARLKHTPTKVLTKVIESLDQRKVLGLIVNDCKDPHLSYYAQYHKNISAQKKPKHQPDANRGFRKAAPLPRKFGS
jgi:capsular exopolysaccharide synthesis family protein